MPTDGRWRNEIGISEIASLGLEYLNNQHAIEASPQREITFVIDALSRWSSGLVLYDVVDDGEKWFDFEGLG
jgi:hypothetical protein